MPQNPFRRRRRGTAPALRHCAGLPATHNGSCSEHQHSSAKNAIWPLPLISGARRTDKNAAGCGIAGLDHPGAGCRRCWRNRPPADSPAGRSRAGRRPCRLVDARVRAAKDYWCRRVAPARADHRECAAARIAGGDVRRECRPARPDVGKPRRVGHARHRAEVVHAAPAERGDGSARRVSPTAATLSKRLRRRGGGTGHVARWPRAGRPGNSTSPLSLLMLSGGSCSGAS